MEPVEQDTLARRSRNPLARIAFGLLGLALLACLLVSGAGVWVWHDEAAQLALLRHLPGLTLTGAHGRLTGGAFAAGQLQWRSADLQVDIESPSWTDARWSWRPYPGAWFGLTLEQAQARRVQVTRTAAPTAARAPSNLRMPFELVARDLRLGALQMDGQLLLSDLIADLHVGADGGTTHRIEHMALARGSLALAGQVSIGVDTGLPVKAVLGMATEPGKPASWRASASLGGPLARLGVDAALRTEAGAAVTAQATLTPFEAWPLAALSLNTRDLDLSVLARGLPQTRLSGRAELTDIAAGQPLKVELALRNAISGAWDAGRLPLRSLSGVLQARTEQPDRIAFDNLVAELGASPSGGRLSGSGRWQGAQLNIQARLQGVKASQLDTRSPPATIDGSIDATLHGLAMPGTAAPAGTGGFNGTAQANLTGRTDAIGKGAPPPPLQLRTDIRFGLPADNTVQVELPSFEARAGAALATAHLQARRDAKGTWAVKTDGELARFDLAAWWSAATGGRASDLNGDWRADLQVPAGAADLLAALRGTADARIKDSRLAGVALSGNATLGAAGEGLKLDAQLAASGNELRVAGHTGYASNAAQWRAELHAPALAALAPVVAMIPGAQGWVPSAGTLQASATATGNWPALRSEGTLQIDALRAQQLQVAKGNARWAFNGTALDAPLALDLDLSGVAQGERRLDRLQLNLAGSLREHTLAVEATSPLRPPAWTETLAGAAASLGSVLQAHGRGHWQPASAASSLGAGAWRGMLTQLRAAPRSEGSTPYLLARNVDATLRLDAAGLPLEASLAPGRVELLGGAISWQTAQWKAPRVPAEAPRVDIEARLEPVKVVPLLATLQPQFAWRGDLALGGRFSVHTGPRFDADITIERSDGDLGMTAEGVSRQLGLTDLRVALAAHGGRWQVSQSLAGRNVGVLSGRQNLQAPADALWPPARSPLEGSLELRLADVGVWAPWLPPGWRLGGELQASAALGGPLDAPTYRGELRGDRLMVRNIFEGVNLREGTLRVALRDTQASIERFDFQGDGGGVLRLRGNVGFGDMQQARLQLVAENFRALDRVDRRVAVSGTADVGMQAGRLSVNGNFTVDEGLIDVTGSDAPALDNDVLVIGRTGPAAPPRAVSDGGKAPETGALAHSDVDVRLDLGRALRLRGRGLDTRLGGQLRIATNTAGVLAVRGTVNTVAGTYTAYGQNLAIDRGVITFTGDVANPRLDILAMRPDVDIRVGVSVTGSPINPRIRLYSEPDLPDLDKITWLMTGHAPESVGRDQAALLQRAALALLAGERGNGDGFLKKFGIDELSVGNSSTGGTVVSIGKQLSKNLTVAYERGLSTTGGNVALLYRVAGWFTVRARTGSDNAVDVIWRWRWN